MRIQQLFPLFWLLCLLVPPAAHAEGAYTITRVADGVFAALQPTEQRFNDSNSAIIINDRDVVVVDSQSSPAKVRELVGEIRRLTDKPVRFVINTHWHGDHTQGNAVYLEAFPGAEVIGHATHLEDVPGRARPYLDEQLAHFETGIAALEQSLETGKKADGTPLTAEEKEALPGRIERNRKRYEVLKSVELALPSVIVDDQLVLHRGTRRIVIHHFKAHTRGDLVVYLPEEKVLITGDLLDDLPYAGHGYPRSWIQALDTLSLLDFDHVISGHGSVQEGKIQLGRVREMLASCVAQVRTGLMGEKSLEEIRESVDPAKSRASLAGDDERAQRAFDAWLPELIERAYLEARGEIE